MSADHAMWRLGGGAMAAARAPLPCYGVLSHGSDADGPAEFGLGSHASAGSIPPASVRSFNVPSTTSSGGL